MLHSALVANSDDNSPDVAHFTQSYSAVTTVQCCYLSGSSRKAFYVCIANYDVDGPNTAKIAVQSSIIT